MMYFSRLKIAVILAVCVLGVVLCLPNVMPAPASWVPWRKIALGLDLRGGSYLLLEVDSAAVARDRLDNLADGARTTLRGKVTGFGPPQVQAAQSRVTIRVPEGPQQAEAVRLLRENASISGTPEFDVAAQGGEVILSLSPAVLRERAGAAVLQSIEIVRRRIDETGVLDPQITRQGENRIVVQLPGVDDPNRIKELIGRTARMTFRLLDENANLAGTPPPGVDFLVDEANPGSRLAVRWRARLDDQLGGLTIEPVRARPGLMADGLALAGLNAVTALIAWALSDEAAFVTGTDFRIDGGLTARIGV